ncbi:type II secretion system F family protein [Candidatus Woesearchaeota archaeon]|nr:type II secretion system F family protein [Candidatus Woesearchaeota archaeon]
MDLIYQLNTLFPHLKAELHMANMMIKPEAFIKKALGLSFFVAMTMLIFGFFMLSVFKASLFLLLPIFIFFFAIFFFFFINSPKTAIRKRQRELDKEVIFAGRFLLVKLYSGTPLVNALMDASKSYGVAQSYFKEMVDDINLGTPVEQAIENGMKYSPSEKFRKILFQINNALKIGVDVTKSLENTLDELTAEQFVEIQKYGKKLNSLALFYMLMAVVIPSLGVAMFVVIGSLVGFFTAENSKQVFIGVIAFLIIIQMVFISIFKTARLSVNL